MESAPDANAATQRMQAHPERMVVLTVANPTESFALNAGSTGSGYGTHSAYAAGGSARSTLAAIAHQYNLMDVTAWPIPALGVHCAVLEIKGDRSRDTVLKALAADARVRLAQPLQTFQTLAADANHGSSYASLQQAVREIGADAAQRVSLGDSVRIALIDTGVDTEHPDIRGRIASALNFVDNDWEQFKRDLHGTEVAGIIAADGAGRSSTSITGIAPHAKLVAIKACWQQDRTGAICNSLTLAQALQAALDARVQIINLSLGGPIDPLLSALVAQAIKKGLVVVGAALPNGDLTAFPVGIPGVIGVDSAQPANTLPPSLAPALLYAPGRDILTITPGGHYDFVSGSSFATAHVTGTVALLLGLASGMETTRVRAVLEHTSGPSQRYARLINACRAAAALHRTCEQETTR
ncbi:S8 family peptidase [Ralstonia sp. 25C]|uniref:S8 family peptidase n=1 Tax=Ralstonia sp. 25C TaxID=3447363 RepID=UPI003F74F20A